MANHINDDVVFPVIALALSIFIPVDIPGVTNIRHHDNQIINEPCIECCTHPTPGYVVACQPMKKIEDRIALL
jgi:hypothetical protein